MKLEVLVATMGQKNLDKYKEMNLNSDVIFANQDDRFELIEENIDSNNVKMITTNYRGVGKNRNVALLNATAELLVLADDDMVYEDDYVNIIQSAFSKIKNADIIIFNIETIGEETRKRRLNTKIKRCNKFNVLNYGAARIVIKKEFLDKQNIWFSMLYGGGAKYSSGEDSLFLIESLNKGARVYTYPKKIAGVKQNESTWFKGYNEKFFFDRGIWLGNAFPNLKYILSLYYAIKLKNTSEKYNLADIFKFIVSGIKEFEK